MVSTVPKSFVAQLLSALVELLAESAHAEFLLQWISAVCHAHAGLLQGGGADVQPLLRALQKGTNRMHADLAGACEANLYTLEYLTSGAASCSAVREQHA